MSKECDPRLPCDSDEKVEEIEETDPRAYCFSLTSKPAEVCLPKSCRIVKKGLEEQDEEEEGAKEPSRLIPIKQPVKTCVPWNEPTSTSKSGVHGGPGVSGTGQVSSFGAAMGLGPSGTMGSGGVGGGIGGGMGGGIGGGMGGGIGGGMGGGIGGGIGGGVGVGGGFGGGGIGGGGIGGAMGGVPLTSSQQSDRETVSLARLVGIAQGPAAIMASFGDTETAKESLASLGALSMGGAIVCECCECDPCICGPRGLNIENILAALKTMMRSGEDLNKLVGALGPGAMKALGTIMGKESEAAAMWATGGGASKDKTGADADAQARAQRGPVETASQIALREAWMRGEFDEMTSCHCLPGMCPCPGGHYIYKPKKMKGKKGIDKKRKKIRKKVKKIGKDGKEYEEWDWVVPSDSDLVSRLSETCVCPPTKHFLTPASSETAVSERLVAPTKRIYWGDLMVCTCPRLQRTLAIIKPESVRFKDVILRAIKNYGLDVLAERQIQLSPEEASEIYASLYGSFRFPNMVVSVSQAPVVVLSLGGIDVVKIWNHIIGPDGTLPSEWFLPAWIGRKFGHYGEIVDALHGSKNLSNAERENRYFFPECYIDPLMKNEVDVKDYIKTYVNPTLLKGLTLLAKTRPIDPVVFLAEWLLTHNPFQPHFPTHITLSPL